MRIGILGYGNLGKALAEQTARRKGMELFAVFSRRSGTFHAEHPILPADSIGKYKNNIDVLLLATGSASDIPRDALRLCPVFHTVDSYDMHHLARQHKQAVHTAALNARHTCAVCVGWDPGIFSLCRAFAYGVFPNRQCDTFWGPGVSQGHSVALRGITGVRYGVQYTVPDDEALARARKGEGGMTDMAKHRRICYVVAEPGKEEWIQDQIASMEGYFLGYKTEVHFVEEEEFLSQHTAFPHAGLVVAKDEAAGALAEVRLFMADNPTFTASIMLAYATAVHRLASEGRYGAFGPSDIPISYLLPPGETADAFL